MVLGRFSPKFCPGSGVCPGQGLPLGGGAALFVLNFVIGGIIGGFVLVWRLLVAAWYVPLTIYRLIVG